MDAIITHLLLNTVQKKGERKELDFRGVTHIPNPSLNLKSSIPFSVPLFQFSVFLSEQQVVHQDKSAGAGKVSNQCQGRYFFQIPDEIYFLHSHCGDPGS